MRKTPSKTRLAVASILCGAAVSLLFAPQSITANLRTAVLDASAPGQQLACALVVSGREHWHRLRNSKSVRDQLVQLKSQRDNWKHRYRKLQTATAVLRDKLDELEHSGAAPYRPADSEPLLLPNLITARVIGVETATQWRAGRFIDKGLADGLRGDSIVLEDDGPVIDQGRSSGLEAAQPVYSGRAVVGKIARVGRQISTVQPVTDPQYRGWARIYRDSSRGMLPGPEGILEGRGNRLCRLTLVGSTETVSAGDNVYTANRGSTLPFPMYYGKVVRAELKPGALQWDVWVEPALSEVTMPKVMVLRTKLNPVRVLGE